MAACEVWFVRLRPDDAVCGYKRYLGCVGVHDPVSGSRASMNGRKTLSVRHFHVQLFSSSSSGTVAVRHLSATRPIAAIRLSVGSATGGRGDALWVESDSATRSDQSPNASYENPSVQKPRDLSTSVKLDEIFDFKATYHG